MSRLRLWHLPGSSSPAPTLCQTKARHKREHTCYCPFHPLLKSLPHASLVSVFPRICAITQATLIVLVQTFFVKCIILQSTYVRPSFKPSDENCLKWSNQSCFVLDFCLFVLEVSTCLASQDRFRALEPDIRLLILPQTVLQ